MSTIVSSATNRNQLILDWDNAQRQLAFWKAKEIELRKAIADDAEMFDPAKVKGTMRFNLGNGFELKCVRKENVTVNNKDGVCFDVLTAVSEMGDVCKHLAKELFRFTPELREAKFEELKEVNLDAYRMVEELITRKPGTPELELIEPKQPK